MRSLAVNARDESAASSIDSDDDAAFSVDAARAAIGKRTKKELTRMRQQAMRAGLQTITAGIAQDTMYLLMNILSQGLLCGQLYINMKTLFPGVFGGEGCNHDGNMKAALLWIYIQFAISAAITAFQTCLWLWQLKVSCCYCFTYHVCPASKLASLTQQKDVRRAYARLRAEQEEANLDEMDDAARDAIIKQYEPEHMDEDFIVFKRFCKEVGSINSLQISCTNARSFLGAVGAIVEPLLSAFSTSQATQATLGALSGAGLQTAETTGRAAAEAEQLVQSMTSFQECMAARQISTSMGAFMAAMGVKQAQMKKSYAKLVILNQIVEEDVERADETTASGRSRMQRSRPKSRTSWATLGSNSWVT